MPAFPNLCVNGSHLKTVLFVELFKLIEKYSIEVHVACSL